MDEVQVDLLKALDQIGDGGELISDRFASDKRLDHQRVVGAIKSLHSQAGLIQADEKKVSRWVLTDEGSEVAREGSHEARVFNVVPQVGCRGIQQSKIMASFANAKIGFSKAVAAGWIVIDKSGDDPLVVRKVESIDDVVQSCVQRIRDLKLDGLPEQTLSDLKKRKLVENVKTVIYHVRKGPNFSLNVSKQETELTAEMIATGSWASKSFKTYNFDALGVEPPAGHLHPLLKVRSEFRQIFLEMGFEEMPTNRYIESSFWNFDALFQPQHHPARDAHDTFFISDPQFAVSLPKDYMERVKKVHSVGGYGSIGYQCEWSEQEARRNVLRTHTTAVTSRMLSALAERAAREGVFRPAKYFSIDRVFRNENLDATHLAEFHQIEGVIVDRGLTLGDLMGVFSAFFARLGLGDLRFKPTYNPYTEPSMEVYSYHKGLKKWVEIGNSGVFRPEMLRPMGLPEDVSALGYGLSLERPTMIRYGYTNIRDLFGPRIDLQRAAHNPICRLDK